MFVQFITDLVNYRQTRNYSKWPTFALVWHQSLLGHVRASVLMTSVEKLSTAPTNACFNDSRLGWLLVQTMPSKTVHNLQSNGLRSWLTDGQRSLLINLDTWCSSHCHVVLALCTGTESCCNIHGLFWNIVGFEAPLHLLQCPADNFSPLF